MLGFLNQLPLVAAEMKKRGMSLAMLEHYTQLQFKNQDGMFALGELSGYSVARLHQLLKVEQTRNRRWRRRFTGRCSAAANAISGSNI